MAASSVFPVFGFPEWHYNNLTTVILYPSSFNESLSFDANAENKKIAGMVGTGIYENKMIFSGKTLRHGFANNTEKKIRQFMNLYI